MIGRILATVWICVTVAASAAPPTKKQIASQFANLPLRFEANAGQTDARVRFLARGAGYTLFLGAAEATLALPDAMHPGRESIVKLELAGGDASADTSGLDPLTAQTTYFRVDPSGLAVKSYRRVLTRNVYAGIDAVFYGNQRQLEYDFKVAPGADPSRVRLRFSGARKTRIDEDGALVLETSGPPLRLARPVSYQYVNGVKREIGSRYVKRSANEAGFALGAYDKSLPLVIDPVILYYGASVGGTNVEQNLSIAIDGDGDAYVTGITRSPDYPVVPGALVGTQSGFASYDAFVSKLNPTGTALIYSGYFYVGNFNFPPKIAVDAAGNAYLAPVNAPRTAGVFTSSAGGGLAKLNSAGTALLYAVALPGIYNVNGLAIDAAGNSYIAGTTFGGLPVTTGAFQSTYAGTTNFNGVGDAYVYKVSPDATKLVYCTYLGGSGEDTATGISVDSAGNAIVTGTTTSSNFPLLNALQTTNKGGGEAFVSKLNPAGTALVYSTYLGGTGADVSAGVAVDIAGNAYVVGFTSSSNYPTTSGALRTTFTVQSGFVSKLSSAGALTYSTYVGGTGSTAVSGVAVDSAGDAFIVGSGGTVATTSDALNTTGTNFLAEINPAGSAFVYSTRTLASLISIAVDAAGKNIFAAGGGNAPLTTGAVQPVTGGLTDGYVMRLSDTAPPAFFYPLPAITSLTPSGATSGGGALTVTVSGSGFAQTSKAQFNGSDRATSFVSANQLRVTLTNTDLIVINQYPVTVTTPAPGGGTSNALLFNVAEKTNPAPTLGSVATTAVTAGSPGFSMNLTGTNFLNGSTVRWNGSERVTTFNSATSLSVLILASDIDTPGTGAITVVNPGPGGGTSASLSVTINAAPFAVTGVFPSMVAPGTPDFNMQVSGTGFTRGMVIRWKGVDLPTTYFSSTLLIAFVSALNAALAGNADIVVVNPLGGVFSASLTINITPGLFPWIGAGGIVNGATFLSYGTTPGPPFTVSSLFGVNLASDLFVATTAPLPTLLGGVSVRINGILCPLFFVSKGQVNFLLPFEVLGLTRAYVTVTSNGVTSNPELILLSLFGPSIFTLNQQGTGQGAVLLANTGTFAAPLNSVSGRDAQPVKRGDYISIFASGLGPVYNPPKTGELASGTILSTTTYMPTANVGGVTAPVVFSGLAPGFVGLYQVNVQIPATAPTGDAVQLYFTIGGVKSNVVTIAVQ